MPTTAEVISQSQLHKQLWKLEILAASGPSFEPGQYLSWTFSGERYGPFSIASAHGSLPVLTFYARHAFSALKPGDTLELSEARGQMTASDSNKRYVLCAGGTGVTPFVSLWDANRTQNHDLHLIWSMSESDDRLMLPQQDPRIVAHDYANDPPYTELLKPFLGCVQTNFYIAGPMPFVRLVAQWLLDHHVSAAEISSDMLDITRLAASASLSE